MMRLILDSHEDDKFALFASGTDMTMLAEPLNLCGLPL
jgi:hypothetical protein